MDCKKIVKMNFKQKKKWKNTKSKKSIKNTKNRLKKKLKNRNKFQIKIYK